MKLSSTTFLRISALILVAVGAYGIYSWQMKTEKVREVAPASPSPWYYFAIPLILLIIFGWAILARHPFPSPARKLLLMFALFCGVTYFGVKTFDALSKINWSPSPSAPGNTYNPPPSVRTVVSDPRQINQATPSAPAQPSQPAPAQETPPPRERSYEECWQIARRAYSDDSVAVPPECQQAWSDYKQRQEEIAAQRRQQEEEERQQRAQAERDRRDQEERDRRIAEENRRENERAVREMEERERQRREEQQRRIRETAEGIKRIFRKN